MIAITAEYQHLEQESYATELYKQKETQMFTKSDNEIKALVSVHVHVNST